MPGIVGLGAVITFDTIVKIVDVLLPAGKWVRRWQTVILIGVVAVIVEARWFMLADHVAQLHVLEHSTIVEINRWAISTGIPTASHILHDDTAYFDPKVFPNSRMYGGVLTWPTLRKMQPEIVVLSSSIYEAPWYQKLRQTQNLSREDSYPFSVRLYQDLVEYETPGPTSISGVALLKVIAPTDPDTGPFAPPSFLPWLQSKLTAVLGERVTPWIVAKLVQNVQRIAHIMRLIHNAAGCENDLFGPTLKVYRFDLSQPLP